MNVKFNASSSVNVLRVAKRSLMLPFIVLLLTAGLALEAFASAPTILQVSETVQPGEPINIFGDSFGSSPTVRFAVLEKTGSLGPIMTLPVTASTDYLAQATIPSSIPPGIWEVQIVSSNGASSSWAPINQARIMMLGSEEVNLGGTFQVFGRNMVLTGGTTWGAAIKLTSGSTTLSAPIVSVSRNYLVARVPSTAVAGTSYQISATNGYGGTGGWTTASDSLLVDSSFDPFNIAVGWGSDFTFANNVYNLKTDSRLSLHAAGDGVTNDAPALRAAIQKANQAGGGVVFLPSGNYCVDDGTSIQVLSNVVVEGAGSNLTTLLFGYNDTPSSPPPSGAFIYSRGTNLTGIANLTFQNENTSSTSNRTIEFGFPGMTTSRCFLANINAYLGNGNQISINAVTHGCVANCAISTTSQTEGPAWINGNEDILVKNCSMSYRLGRVQLSCNLKLVVWGCSFTRDTTYSAPGAPESGGLQTSFGRQVAVVGNVISTTGTPECASNNDGEMLMTQVGTVQDMFDAGYVTSATATTLTDTSKSWPTSSWQVPNSSLFNRSAVSIVSGTGLGQRRLIASYTSDSITLTTPWTVVPDSTSQYIVSTWNTDQHLYLNNTIQGGKRGIEFYNGAWDSVVDGNTVTNSGAIWARSDSEVVGTSGLRRIVVDPVWSTWIGNNSDLDTNAYQPANIIVEAVIANQQGFGAMQMGTEVRHNVCQAFNPNLTQSSDYGDSEGYYDAFIVQYASNTLDPIGLLASIFAGNKAVNLSSPLITTGVPDLPQVEGCLTSQARP